ncbi:MAG TPA: ABC transporter permease [Gammaproteobacteria bacterium]|nr:ABC transporter permease [Gammaproteobacteria bacterium]
MRDLTLAARSVLKHKLDAAAGIAGLALGLACFLGAYVFAEYVASADRSFPHADRIYAMYEGIDVRAMNLTVPLSSGASYLLADAMRTDFPELEAVARSRTEPRAVVGVGADTTFRKIRYVEPEFLEIFELPFIAGSARAALAPSRSAVLTQATARALFGRADAVGRSIHVEGIGDVEVAGVISALPEPSLFGRSIGADDPVEIFVVTRVPEDIRGAEATLPQDAPIGLQWFFGPGGDTYVLFPERGLTAQQLNARMPAFAARHVALDGAKIAFEARPISDVFRSGIDDVFGFSDLSMPPLMLALGGLVLGIACVNYVSLATARSLVKAKEVGLRKVLGARRGHVMRLYLVESVLAAALAMPVALLVLELAILALDGATGLRLDPPWGASFSFWAFVVALTLATGAVSAAYPAFALAGVKPLAALRAGAVRAGPKHLRTVLIGVQFAAASFLLIGVLVVAGQNAELRRSAVAIQGDPLVVIPIRLGDAGIDPTAFEARLRASPYIAAVTGASVAPWEPQVGGSGYTRTAGDLSTVRFTQEQAISFGYFDALGTRMLAGRTFSPDRDDAAATSRGKIVIDRAAAEQFGWRRPEDAVGQTLYGASSTMFGGDYSPVDIIGVVEHAPPRVFGWGIRAFIYHLDRSGISFPIVRISRANVPAALAHIDATWRALAPRYPLKREFADERFERSYRMFEYTSRAFMALAGVAFLIAVTGLVSLTLFVSARRRHEMGVRKVLGASSERLLRSLAAEYLRPVLIANLVAWPAAYAAAETYVSLFVHPLRLSPAPFLASLGITLLIGGAVVVRQALRSARVAPADVLRYE